VASTAAEAVTMRTREAGESSTLLLDAIAVLQTAGVDYAVVGAMAGAFHGVVRASMDADAVLSVGVREGQRVRQALLDAGFAVELRTGDLGDPIAAVLEARDCFENRVDLLIGLKGMDAGVFTRAMQVRFGGELINVVGLEDFIAMKLFAGGPQDLFDATQAREAALASTSVQLDMQLISRLVQSFGRDAIANFKAIFPESR
jgi:hypothetical protein